MALSSLSSLSLHDALPICSLGSIIGGAAGTKAAAAMGAKIGAVTGTTFGPVGTAIGDRKSTRLNSSHVAISYAVFCLKKKKKNNEHMENDKTMSRIAAGSV